MPDPTALYHRLEADLAARVSQRPFAAAINLRLERIADLLARLDSPHLRVPVVHIGGTSGKGSTATFTAAVLQAHGLRVGLHLSPHLQIVNERHQIDGRPAPTSRLWALWQRMVPAVEAVGREGAFGPPSYFEAHVALALLLFAEEGVDVAVVEVGLGGSLDATNIIPARVAVLTNVGLDHTEILGDTPLQIARDKAGIFKPGQQAITGVTQPEVIAHVEARCADLGVPLRRLHRDFPPLQGVPLGLDGEFQAHNAALAVEAARAFWPDLDPVRTQAALAAAHLPGRLEVVQQAPHVLLDGAHNPDKIRAAAASVGAQTGSGRRRIAVVALKAGKDAADILPHIDAQCDAVILTRFYDKGLWHAVPPEDLRAFLPHAAVVEDPLEAVQAALDRARPEDTVWITGSLYLIGDVRERWFPLPDLLAALEDGGEESRP